MMGPGWVWSGAGGGLKFVERLTKVEEVSIATEQRDGPLLEGRGCHAHILQSRETGSGDVGEMEL